MCDHEALREPRVFSEACLCLGHPRVVAPAACRASVAQQTLVRCPLCAKHGAGESTRDKALPLSACTPHPGGGSKNASHQKDVAFRKSTWAGPRGSGSAARESPAQEYFVMARDESKGSDASDSDSDWPCQGVGQFFFFLNVIQGD